MDNVIKQPISRLLTKWDNCTIEEKLEKLRDEIRAFNYTNTAVASLRDDVEKLGEHSHTVKGDIHIPFKQNYKSSNSVGRMSYLD